MSRVRVLVCDDSAFARKVLRDVLSIEPSIEVVGSARDGLDALEKIGALHPDVITLDLVMPHLDGLGLLAELAGQGPRVVVVTSSTEDSELVVRALQAGAITAVHKPTSLATERLYEIGSEVVKGVLLAASASAPTRPISSFAVNANSTGCAGGASRSSRASSSKIATATALSVAPGLSATVS